MFFKHITNKKVNLNGHEVLVRLGDGCTGIGSRELFINNHKMIFNVLCFSDDLEGELLLMRGCWRDQPWDKIYFLFPIEMKDKIIERFTFTHVGSPEICDFTETNWFQN